MGFTLFSRPETALVHQHQQPGGEVRWVMIGGRLHPLLLVLATLLSNAVW